MTKLKDGWTSWTRNPMIEYFVTTGQLRIRFKSHISHSGWERSWTGTLDDTIREHLTELAAGKSLPTSSAWSANHSSRIP